MKGFLIGLLHVAIVFALVYLAHAITSYYVTRSFTNQQGELESLSAFFDIIDTTIKYMYIIIILILSLSIWGGKKMMAYFENQDSPDMTLAISKSTGLLIVLLILFTVFGGIVFVETL